MTMRRMGYVAVVGWLALLPSGSPAQDAVQASSLRLRGDVEPPARGLQTVCGRVFNDQQRAARRVRVRVEGLDERGEGTRRRGGGGRGRSAAGAARRVPVRSGA